jgi:hypothetical protein
MTSSDGMTFKEARETNRLSGASRGPSQRRAWKLNPRTDKHLADRRSELERR